MSRIKEAIEELSFEEIVETLNQINYYEQAMKMLYHGKSYQKKCINYYMENLKGEQLDTALQVFIDTEIEIERWEV